MSQDKDSLLNPEDQFTWKVYTEGVKPLWKNERRSAPLIIEENIEILDEPSQIKTTPKTNPFHTPSTRDLKNVKIEARLDLHGCNVLQAHERVIQFILNAHTKRLRCILIITGKGTAPSDEWWSETGILRQQVPRWMHEHPLESKITSYTTAKKEHGGAGALYAFLKKHRI